VKAGNRQKEVIVAEIFPDSAWLTEHAVADAQAYFDEAVRQVNSAWSPTRRSPGQTPPGGIHQEHIAENPALLYRQARRLTGSGTVRQ
jgi:hypothetical protein